MEPAVQAAIVTSSVALGVAVIGVIATGVAQVKATKRAHANALALFEQQANQQRQLHGSEVKERIRLAHLEDRKSAYLKFQVAVDTRDFLRAQEANLETKLEALSEENYEERMKVLKAQVELANEVTSLIDQTIEAINLIQLVAPSRVANAAIAWGDAARAREPEAEQKREVFITEARIDIGSQQRK